MATREQEKPVVWRYSVPSEDGVQGWGVILMDSRGMFSAVSDYGNYAHGWWSFGHGDFRAFIVEAAEKIARSGYFDYFCSKLGRETHFDEKKTAENIREYLYEARRERRIPKDNDEACKWVKEGRRHAWYDLSYQSPYGSSHGFREEADLLKQLECRELSPDQYVYQSHIPDVYESLVFEYEPMLRMFATKLMPRLGAIIRAELEREGVAIAS